MKIIKPIPRYFKDRAKVTNPDIIYPRPEVNREGTVYDRKKLEGTYYLVTPGCPLEIGFLRMLDHHVDKFAPASGDGIIVTPEALAKIDA